VHAVGGPVRDGRDREFVGAGGLLKLFELVGDGGWRSDQPRVDAVLDQLAVLIAPLMGSGDLGGRVGDRRPLSASCSAL
jgi:hypothetical protein